MNCKGNWGFQESAVMRLKTPEDMSINMTKQGSNWQLGHLQDLSSSPQEERDVPSGAPHRLYFEVRIT